MGRAIKIVLVLQILLAVAWVLTVASIGTEGGLALLALYFYYLVFSLPFMLFGLWALWKRPEVRRNAAVIAGLPVAALFAPTIIKTILGGPLHGWQIAGLLLLAFVAFAIFSVIAPRQASTFIPNALFRSRLWNGLILAGIVFAWAYFIVIVLFLLNESSSNNYRDDSGTGLAYAMIFGSAYIVIVSAAFILTSVWALLGLRGGVDDACRKLNIAQLLVAAPGIAIGAVVVWLMTQA